MQSSEQGMAVLVWQSKTMVLFKLGHLAHFALRGCLTQERLCPINKKGKANRLKQAIAIFAKSNMPIQPFFVLL
jgi:hypothetical protein